MIIYLLITGVSLSFLDIARIDVVPFLLLFLQTWKWDGMLALGKAVHIKDNILSMIGSKHSLHLYLYSPFVACVFSLLQMILFQTARHQEVITVVVVLGTTWLVMQGWFIRAIEKFKIA